METWRRTARERPPFWKRAEPRGVPLFSFRKPKERPIWGPQPSAPGPSPHPARCGPRGRRYRARHPPVTIRCLARHRWRAAIHTPGRPPVHDRGRAPGRLPMQARPAWAAVRPPGRRGRADAPARPCGAKVCAACAAQKKGKAKPCGRVAALPFFWRVCRTIFPAKVHGAEKRPCRVVAVFRPRGPPPPPGTNRGGGVVAPRPCVGTTPSRAGGFAPCGRFGLRPPQSQTARTEQKGAPLGRLSALCRYGGPWYLLAPLTALFSALLPGCDSVSHGIKHSRFPMPPIMVQRTTNRLQVSRAAVLIDSPHFPARMRRHLNPLGNDTGHAEDPSNAAQILIDS